MVKACAACLIFFGFATLLSFLTYEDPDFGTSAWPWRIGVIVTFIAFAAIIGSYIRYRKTCPLLIHGVIAFTGAFSFYYIFGVFMYFYFFIFSPMNSWARCLGVGSGVVLTIYRYILSRQNIKHIENNPEFINKVFHEYHENIIFYRGECWKEINKFYKRENTIPKYLKNIAYILAPASLASFSLIRIISNYHFGAESALILMAALGFPLSLVIVNFLAHIYFIQIALPLRLKKERHKPVLIDD